MKLTLQGLQEKEQWKNAGIGLPSYDIEKVAEETKKTRCGYILEPEIFSVFLSEGSQIH